MWHRSIAIRVYTFTFPTLIGSYISVSKRSIPFQLFSSIDLGIIFYAGRLSDSSMAGCFFRQIYLNIQGGSAESGHRPRPLESVLTVNSIVIIKKKKKTVQTLQFRVR